VKEFWPDRRVVVDFMSHTYSRTKALFGEFSSCLDEADIVIMHKIYASARENPDPGVSGSSLFEAASRSRAAAGRGGEGKTLYFEEPLGALGAAGALLRPGDLFLTMGAGDNWKLGAALLEALGKDKAR
jgi:UDP-N-acetylmuramate--alanine ligase